MRKGLSTAEEIVARAISHPIANPNDKFYSERFKEGLIYKASQSELRPNVIIVTFRDGSQANVDLKTWNELLKKFPGLFAVLDVEEK